MNNLEKINKTIQSLKNNNMNGYYVENKDIYSFYKNEDLDMITSKLNNIIRK